MHEVDPEAVDWYLARPVRLGLNRQLAICAQLQLHSSSVWQRVRLCRHSWWRCGCWGAQTIVLQDQRLTQ